MKEYHTVTYAGYTWKLEVCPEYDRPFLDEKKAKYNLIPKTMEINKITEVCHEINKIYCESLGDYSQVPWEDALDWQVASAKAGVHYHISNTTAGPEDSHENWLNGKKADGWVYGKVKDIEKKEHPCMVPYLDLPRERQVKDKLLTKLVHLLKD